VAEHHEDAFVFCLLDDIGEGLQREQLVPSHPGALVRQADACFDDPQGLLIAGAFEAPAHESKPNDHLTPTSSPPVVLVVSPSDSQSCPSRLTEVLCGHGPSTNTIAELLDELLTPLFLLSSFLLLAASLLGFDPSPALDAEGRVESWRHTRHLGDRAGLVEKHLEHVHLGSQWHFLPLVDERAVLKEAADGHPDEAVQAHLDQVSPLEISNELAQIGLDPRGSLGNEAITHEVARQDTREGTPGGLYGLPPDCLACQQLELIPPVLGRLTALDEPPLTVAGLEGPSPDPREDECLHVTGLKKVLPSHHYTCACSAQRGFGRRSVLRICSARANLTCLIVVAL